MRPVSVGKAPPGVGTPAIYVTVEEDDDPILRVDVYEAEPAVHAFADAVVWAGLVVIGFGDHVHLVSPASGSANSCSLNGYFGHLYPVAERLLVADAERLHCFEPSGSRLWSTAVLGIDGVVVDAITDGVVEGSGEWDPPGGWEPFRVLLSSGEVLAGRTRP